jgi:hypothetical protein
MKLTVKEVKREAEKLYRQILDCLDKDSEWTSPRGNGVYSGAAYQTASAFMALIRRLGAK